MTRATLKWAFLIGLVGCFWGCMAEGRSALASGEGGSPDVAGLAESGGGMTTGEDGSIAASSSVANGTDNLEATGGTGGT